MWELQLRLLTLVSNLLSQHQGRRGAPSGSADWLPPVLGPSDWSIGMMSDRSANWYFERDRA